MAESSTTTKSSLWRTTPDASLISPLDSTVLSLQPIKKNRQHKSQQP